MKPSAFATICTQNSDAWKSDWDVYLNAETLNKLSLKCMVDEDLIKRSCFYYNCDYFYNQTGQTPQVKWVMPIGMRTDRECFGLHFCPCCLAEDGKMPYFRKHWRLGFFSACLFHGVQLHDRCPSCQEPINNLRLSKHTEKLLYHPEDVAFCQHCGFDLRNAPIEHASKREIEINRQHFTLYTLGYGTVGNVEFNYSNLYFEGIRRLLSFIVCDPFGGKMFVYLRDKLGLHHPYHRELIPKHSEIEFMDIKARRAGLLMLHYLIDDWPTRFIKVAEETGVSAQFFSTPNVYFPYWVSDVLRFEINRDPIRLSRDENRHAKAFFERKLGRNIQSYDVYKYIKQVYGTDSATVFTSLKALRKRKNRESVHLYSLSIVLRRRLQIVCVRLYRKGVPASKIAAIYGIRKNNIWKWIRNGEL